MKILIWGICGRLGNSLYDIATKRSLTVCGGVDIKNDYSLQKYSCKVFNNIEEIDVFPDVIIDFSYANSIENIASFAKNKNIPTVIATTGHNQQQLQTINQLARCVPVFKSSNMSIGVNVLIKVAKTVAEKLNNWDIEIVETHHKNKVDAPSGTALTIVDEINSTFDNCKQIELGRASLNKKRQSTQIGVHSIRGGTSAGQHDIYFLGDNETLSISHCAQSPVIFTIGALAAAEFIYKQSIPKLYNMADLLVL